MVNTTSASPTTPAAPTNTLTLTNLESHHFEPSILSTLRTHTESFGKVCFFSPIKSFHRIFVVYHSIEHSQAARLDLHNNSSILEDGTVLRVYFGQHTELTIDPKKHYLQMPSDEPVVGTDAVDASNGMVSPPGSPPLGHSDESEDEMAEIEELDLTLDGPILIESVTPVEPATTPTTPAKDNSLQQQIKKLRIDTLVRSSSASSLLSGHPRTPVSPGHLYPSTPTRLAFSPSKESQDEQPFITIQDWGIQSTVC
ncbi:carbohydrate-binding module 1 protein [Haplosporangium gracile]|nr:carbohydrate-binding module 1 protein [Haplosporangium gracile]